MIRNIALLLAVVLIVAACSGDDPEDMMEQGRKLEKEGKLSEALTLYETVFKQYEQSPQAPEALYRSAAIYYREQNDPLKAATAYELVSEKYPTSEYGHLGLFVAGFTYANELKNYDRAKKAFNRYLAEYPDSSRAGDVRFELEHLGKSPEEVLQSLQDSSPPPAPAHQAAARPNAKSN